MNKSLILALSVFALTAAGGAAEAKGCVKGAVVGGVAGHFAGRHPVLGAAAGCVIGHHMAKTQEKKQMAAQHQPHR